MYNYNYISYKHIDITEYFKITSIIIKVSRLHQYKNIILQMLNLTHIYLKRYESYLFVHCQYLADLPKLSDLCVQNKDGNHYFNYIPQIKSGNNIIIFDTRKLTYEIMNTTVICVMQRGDDAPYYKFDKFNRCTASIIKIMNYFANQRDFSNLAYKTKKLYIHNYQGNKFNYNNITL